jgi:hypothetical protein
VFGPTTKEDKPPADGVGANSVREVWFPVCMLDVHSREPNPAHLQYRIDQVAQGANLIKPCSSHVHSMHMRSIAA